MFNRLRSYLCVYQRAIEVVLIITALLLGGGVAGYSLARMELRSVVNSINEQHVGEVERLQQVHRTSMRYMSQRLQELISQQAAMADEIAQASRAARSAAATAGAAAKNAANANIQVKEEPARERRSLPEVSP